MIEAILAAVGLVACTAAITSTAIFVCRALEWSPVNIVVNVYRSEKEQE
jgi:hypothetical protein